MGPHQDAIASYDRALTRRPEWNEAIENRELASARAKLTDTEGGDMGDQMLGADKIIFDKKKDGGQEAQIESDKSASNSSMQALWLRRIQTSPEQSPSPPNPEQNSSSQNPKLGPALHSKPPRRPTPQP